MYLFPNLSVSESICFRIYLFPILSVSESIWLRIYLVTNLSGYEPIWLSNLSNFEPIRFWPNPILTCQYQTRGLCRPSVSLSLQFWVDRQPLLERSVAKLEAKKMNLCLISHPPSRWLPTTVVRPVAKPETKQVNSSLLFPSRLHNSF